MYTTAWKLFLAAAVLTAATGTVRGSPADDQYAVAAGHYGRARWRLAVEEFERFLDRFPQHEQTPQVTFYLAEALVKLGQYAQAEKRFEQFLALGPENAHTRRALFRVGEMAYLAGRHADARDRLDRFRRDYPDDALNAYALPYAAELARAENRWDEARELYVAALDRYPNSPMADDCRFGLGITLRQQGDGEAARRFFQPLADKKDSPQSEQATVQLALLDYDAGKFAAAAEALGQFLGQHPQSEQAATARYWLGRSLLKREEYDKAIAVFEPLVEPPAGNTAEPPAGNAAEPGKDRAQADDSNLYLLALAYLGAGRFDDSLGALDRIDPQSADPGLQGGAHVARASALMGLKRYDEAVEPLHAYIVANPRGDEVAKCRAELAIALAALGDWDQAQKTFNTFQQEHAADPLLLPTMAHLADAAYQAGHRDWARQLYETLAHEDNPPEYRTQGLSGLAWTQLKDDDPGHSAETFGKLLREHPDDRLAAETIYARAIALMKNRQYEAALTQLDRIVEQYPSSKQVPDALLTAAKIHVRSERNDKAATYFERLVKHYPDHPQMPSLLYQWAWALADSGQQDRADEIFSQLYTTLKQTRYWADATYRLAERATLAKDYARAERLIDELLASNAQGEVVDYALFLKGQLAATLQRWEDVAAPMRRLLDEFPKSRLRISAEFWIAEAEYHLGNYEQADQQFAELRQKTQGRRDAWLAILPLRQAQVLAHNERWDEAIALASPIVERYPNFRQAYEADYVIGRALAGKGRFRESREAYTRVVDSPLGAKTETAAMAQFMIGETYLHQRQYDDAIRAFHRVEILYDYPEWKAAALLQAGKCHEEKGQWLRAIELYGRLLDEYPHTTHTEEAKQRRTVAVTRAKAGQTPRPK